MQQRVREVHDRVARHGHGARLVERHNHSPLPRADQSTCPKTAPAGGPARRIDTGAAAESVLLRGGRGAPYLADSKGTQRRQ